MKLVGKCRVRCLATGPSEPRPEAPPPPPIPPPPPSTVKRRDEANRREAMGALFASVGTAAVFLVVKDQFTSRVDEKPNPEKEVLQTRIKRNEKGQPFVQASDGDWLLVKPSSKTAGVVYLRDRIGRVYRLVVSDRVQVDVSSDNVMLDVFGDGQWESAVEQLMKQNGNEVLISENDFLKST